MAVIFLTVHLAYFDETYLKDVEHAVLALVLPADKVAELETALDKVVEKAERQHGVSSSIELHGYELANGENDWAVLDAVRARVRIYKDAVRAITSIEGAALCRGSVDLARRNPGDAHHWSLVIALECTNLTASRQGSRVIGICDDIGNKSVYQTMFANARRTGTPGAFGNKLPSFLDGLHFTPSCHSRPVQAIDMLSYVYRRNFINPHPHESAAKAYEDLWSMVKPLLDRGAQRTW